MQRPNPEQDPEIEDPTHEPEIILDTADSDADLDEEPEETPAPRRPGQRPGAPMPPNSGMRSLIWIVGFLVVLGAIATFANPYKKTTQEIGLSELSKKVAAGEVEKVTVTNNTALTIKLKGGEERVAEVRDFDSLKDYGITTEKTEIVVTTDNTSAIWITILQLVLPSILVFGIIYYMMRATSGANMRAMNFGQSKARTAIRPKVRFKDVAGQAEAKQELMEEVEFLKNPKKFQAMGAEIPKGILLVGPPGTGKTLLAKAVAGEAKVPFFSLSASEFVEMFVGVGASRVRDLFAKAKKNSPCIIFIDELDAIGRQRGSGMGGGHDEREQTLNQILVEMDGFETDAGVIVMAATNRQDVLDPALLRPGRFDRRVTVDLPTKDERLQVLKIYAEKKPLATNIDLDKIASQTAGMSPAELKNIMNEAAILAARNNLTEITQAILHEAAEKVLVGPERPSRVLHPEEKRITAVHEAGHAIVGHVLPHTDDVHKVTVISRGNALGLTWSLPKEDRHMVSEEKFHDELAMLLGGRLAEQLVIGSITTGASNDLQRATAIARNMITRYGMSPLGLRTYGEHQDQLFGRTISESKDYSEAVSEDIDKQVLVIMAGAEKRAKEVLQKHLKALNHLAEELIEKETITGEELTAMLEADTGVQKDAPTLA